MSLKLKSNRAVFSLLTAICLLAIVGAFVYQLIVPLADKVKARADAQALEQELSTKFRDSRDDLDEASAIVEARTWTGSADQISPIILAETTQFAKDHRVRIGSFRPQRIVQNEGLDQLTFLVLAEGRFLDVMAFAKDLEEKSTKTAVAQIQISSSNGEGDTVSAAIGLAAYLKPEEEGGASG
jgi:hypothetical protein